MIHYVWKKFVSLKGIGLTVIVVMLLLTLSAPALAAGGVTPSEAVPLADEGNTGSLEPGDQHWYLFTWAGSSEMTPALTLVVQPDDRFVVDFVNLELFAEDQIPLFSAGDTSGMTSFGSGEVVSRDNNPDAGVVFWTGQIAESGTYYVQVLNSSDFSVNYQLFNSGFEVPQPPPQPEEPVQEEELQPEAAAEDVPAPETFESGPTAPPQIGTDPGNPAILTPGLKTGQVAPFSTYWYTFKYDDFSGETDFKELDYSLVFTPDDGNRRHRINFELYPYSEVEIWRRSAGLEDLTNFGAGMLVDRDTDPFTGQRVWRGSVNMGDSYLLAISNGTDIPIDYWLYDDDIYNPELGPKPAPEPAPVFAQGAAPQTANELKIGLNKGRLEPGEEGWYAFRITDFDNEDLEEMALTMIATPDDGNRIRNVTFDVFTAGGTVGWSPGDNSQINNLGAGSVVYRDTNPLTGERFWHGWINDNDLYYVQVRNGTNSPMDYWLYTGDVYSPELGEPTRPKPPPEVDPGEAPYAPVDLKLGVTKDELEPGTERWYTFTRRDAQNPGERLETIFTLVFTPNDGNNIRDVNFELFEANQLRDWAPDNRFNLVNFGSGSVIDRDGDLTTGELIWKGHVLAGDTYYIRVTNETGDEIDYWIFPEDVVNTSLERAR